MALETVKNEKTGAIPPHLRDAHYKGASKLGHGTEYIYPHDFPGHFIVQQYLPKELEGSQYYLPTENGQEKVLKDRLQQCWKNKK